MGGQQAAVMMGAPPNIRNLAIACVLCVLCSVESASSDDTPPPGESFTLKLGKVVEEAPHDVTRLPSEIKMDVKGTDTVQSVLNRIAHITAKKAHLKELQGRPVRLRMYKQSSNLANEVSLTQAGIGVSNPKADLYFPAVKAAEG